MPRDPIPTEFQVDFEPEFETDVQAVDLKDAAEKRHTLAVQFVGRANSDSRPIVRGEWFLTTSCSIVCAFRRSGCRKRAALVRGLGPDIRHGGRGIVGSDSARDRWKP
jgi:hypothetical protein